MSRFLGRVIAGGTSLSGSVRSTIFSGAAPPAAPRETGFGFHLKLFESAGPRACFGGRSWTDRRRYWQDVAVAISREEVLHVAKLARLALSEEETARFQEQLSAILEAIGKVSELDLTDVPPTSHPLALVNVVDRDEPRPSLSREQALANAPESEAGAFRVPASG
jgi:aspartyl-tRNA(Asn)/glutamyl-tRNA(Gln) amidotransferase subunit C